MYTYVTYIYICITYIPEARVMCTLQNISASLMRHARQHVLLYFVVQLINKQSVCQFACCHVCICKYVSEYGSSCVGVDMRNTHACGLL